MKSQIPIDGAGRIVLPKAVRDELQLVAGDLLEISLEDNEVRLHPARSGNRLKREDGFWVFRTGKQFDSSETEAILASQRNDRHKKLVKGSD